MHAAAPNVPLRIGRPEEFASVRNFFQQSGFDDVTLCRVLAMDDMSDLGRVQWDQIKTEAWQVSLRWCVDVFVRGLAVSTKESRTICGSQVLQAFESLGLLRPAKKDPLSLLCPVWLYPADGFIVVSDRRDDPDGEPYNPPEDVVFPAIYAGTLRFLKLLPRVAGEALDLCGGSGIGALRLSRSASVAATADLTERSAFFAEFNARLNNISVTSLCGDLYGPVGGREFDLITAHPPFVPATGPNMVYRDGGDTGEEVTRRIIEGLPAHLRKGGTCVILCVARDTKEKTFEQRAYDWLGAAASEFDIVFGLEKVLSVDGVVESMRKRGQQIAAAEAQELSKRLRSLGTHQFVYGALVLRRCAEVGVQPPLRVHLSPEGTGDDFERLFSWRSHCRKAEFRKWLITSRPHFSPELELTARHTVQDRALVPAEFVFSIQGGIPAALRPDPWVVPLIARLEGKRSVQEVFDAARSADELPQGFTLDAFADLVRGMIERRFLAVDLQP